MSETPPLADVPIRAHAPGTVHLNHSQSSPWGARPPHSLTRDSARRIPCTQLGPRMRVVTEKLIPVLHCCPQLPRGVSAGGRVSAAAACYVPPPLSLRHGARTNGLGGITTGGLRRLLEGGRGRGTHRRAAKRAVHISESPVIAARTPLAITFSN